MTVGNTAPVLKPLKLSCTTSDCGNALHCFLQKTQKPRPQGGPCRSCGDDLVDFPRVQARDFGDVEHTFEALGHEWIRHEFWHRPFDLRAMNHARRKGMRVIREEYAAKQIRQAVGKARHPREGRQTAYEGNVVSYAQHAVAGCCRRCIEYWHGIPMGSSLTDEQVEFLKRLVLLYLERRLPNLNEEPMKVPSIRKANPKGPSTRKAGSRKPAPARQVMADWLDTDKVSASYRAKSVRLDEGKLLISNFLGTGQAEDLTKPPNCKGFGRIRHFRRDADPSWVPNPLPIDPASRALGLDPSGLLHAQVFQNAACNWRCWYCFVPFNMLDASDERAAWVTAGELVDLYLAEDERPPMIDLTGGQPELVPEWVPWTMRALRERGMEGKVFLWSDDNLSVDYFWSVLSDADRELVATFKGYGRVGCFKGFDPASFAFNTRAAPELFDRQFELMRRYIGTGIDVYAYTTFTALVSDGIEDAMKRFVDRLQALHPNLPLRTVPLKIGAFGVVKKRLAVNDERYAALEHQKRAIDAWRLQLEARFSASDRARSIVDVPV